MSGKAVKDIGKVLVSEEVEQALDIEAKARKRDKQEILREVMTAWARERHTAYRLFARRAVSKGFQLELEGIDEEEERQRSK